MKIRILLWVIILAFVLRAGLALTSYMRTGDFSLSHDGDTAEYVAPGRNLYAHGSFATDRGPEIIRTPGYPILLMAGVATQRLELTTIALQTLLSCATVLMVFLIARRLSGSDRAAVFAALLYAIEPLSIAYVSKLLTETLFTFLITCMAYVLVRYVEQDRPRFMALAALFLSASVYVRPVAYFLPVLVAVFFIVLIFRSHDRRQARAAHVTMFIVISGITIGAWQLRNYATADYAGFSGIAAVNLYQYNAAAAVADARGVGFCEQRAEAWKTVNRLSAIHPEWTEPDMLRYQQREGMRLILENPVSYFKVHALGAARTLLGPGLAAYFQLFGLDPESKLMESIVSRSPSSGLYAFAQRFVQTPLIFLTANAILFLVLLAYLMLAGIGIAEQWRSKPVEVLLLCLIVAYFILIASNGASRFRHPAMPLISVFAGCALSWLLVKRVALKNCRAAHRAVSGIRRES